MGHDPSRPRKKKRWTFYVPVLTPAGLEMLNRAARLPGVRASATGMTGGVWETRQISFEVGNNDALHIMNFFSRYPGLREIPLWPVSYLEMPDWKIVDMPREEP